jgi:hypothetical protein
MSEGFPKTNQGTKPKANVWKQNRPTEDDKNTLTSIPDLIMQ